MDSRFPGKSQQLVLPNDTYKAKLLGGLVDWKLEELESWLFHGTECLDDILREGVSSGHVHLMSKKYSAGTYFASDPRLAHYFVRRTLRMVAEGQERLSCPVCLRSYSRSSALSVLTPEGTELERVERWESHALVMPYNAQKRRVCEELGFTWTREDVESCGGEPPKSYGDMAHPSPRNEAT